MAVSVRLPKGPLYTVIDGERLNRAYHVDLYRSALRYEPRPDDNFVVTFKKSGTNWAKQIGYLLFHDGVPPSSAVEFMRSTPFLEMYGAEAVEVMNRPGIIHTHLPYELIPKCSRAKYLCVCRNPKDVCVSLFYHTRGNAVYDFKDGSFEDFFEVFISGQTDNGDYFDHVLSWYAHRDDPNVLMVHYEDMKHDPRNLVLRIAEFLDQGIHKLLIENESFLQKVLHYSTIEFMKVYFEEKFDDFFANPLSKEIVPQGVKVFHESMNQFPMTATYTRKGIVGDWKAHFTPEMSRRMEEKIMQKMAHTDLIETWKKHGVI